MKSNRPAMLFILATAINLFGCGNAVEKRGGGDKAAATPPGVNAAGPTPATADGAGAAAAPSETAAPPASTGEDTPQQGTSPASGGLRAAGGAPPAKMPTPQIGSGGNDLFLFTQVRAAINNDPDLKAANVVIDVKGGIVTLGGTVASATLKSKAEQLARGAGSKEVRNQLRVSTGP